MNLLDKTAGKYNRNSTASVPCHTHTRPPTTRNRVTMALCGLCRPSHERLLDSCYPSNKVLSSSSHPGNVKPSSNELGRLAFLCANAPAAKLAKVTTLLQTRAARQAKHATRNAKYKSQLCISLDILNRLSEDCRPILTAAAPAALEIIASALTVPDTSGSAAGYSASGGSWDSTVVEHAASAVRNVSVCPLCVESRFTHTRSVPTVCNLGCPRRRLLPRPRPRPLPGLHQTALHLVQHCNPAVREECC